VKQTAAVGADGSAPARSSTSASAVSSSYLFEHRRQIRGLLAMIRAIIRRTARSDQSAEEYAALFGRQARGPGAGFRTC